MYTERIAKLLSNIFNPVTLGLLIIVLIAYHTTASLWETLKLTLTLVGINTVPLVILVIYLRRRGKIDSIFIHAREQRTAVFLAAIALMLLSGIFLHLTDASRIAVALTIAVAVITFVYMCVNFRWKISMHAAFGGIALMTLCLFYGLVALISLVPLTAVGWSRIRLGYHTLTQVVTGTLGVVVILGGVFTVFGLLPV